MAKTSVSQLYSLSKKENKLTLANTTGKTQKILLIGPYFVATEIEINDSLLATFCFCEAVKLQNKPKISKIYKQTNFTFRLFKDDKSRTEIRRLNVPDKNCYIIYSKDNFSLLNLAKASVAVNFPPEYYKEILPGSLGQDFTVDDRPVLIRYQTAGLNKYHREFVTLSCTFLCIDHFGKPSRKLALSRLPKRFNFE